LATAVVEIVSHFPYN